MIINIKNISTKVVLVIIALVLVLPVLTAAISTIIIGPQSTTAAKNSSDIYVPINLENEDPIAGFDLYLNYSEFLIFKNISVTSRMPDVVMDINEVYPGLLVIGALIPENITTGNGTIFNVMFDVDENAIPGNYTISIINATISNIDMETLPFTASEAVFTIVE